MLDSRLEQISLGINKSTNGLATTIRAEAEAFNDLGNVLKDAFEAPPSTQLDG